MSGVLARLRSYASLVALSHTIFAMPFAASAVVLAHTVPHRALDERRVAALIVCMVTARTSAMAFNRFADRDLDARNPRTRDREIPRGAIGATEALALSIVSGVLFVASAATLGRAPGVLGVPVLAFLLGYSYAKRFTWAAHAWLGIALALAPGGAWIAMGASPSGAIVWLMAGVATWLFGFDVLYSLQDEGFDRENGLSSVPARFGTTRALVASAASHLVTVVAFVAAGLGFHRGIIYFGGVGACALVLAWEHVIVGRGDLRRIDRAFFDMNAMVGVGFFACTLGDVLLSSP